MSPTTTTIDSSSTSSSKSEQKVVQDENKHLQMLLGEHGFHENGKFVNGCYCKKVTSKNVDLPELIKTIFPNDNEGNLWILAKGRLDKKVDEDQISGKENNEENLSRLANLGRYEYCS